MAPQIQTVNLGFVNCYLVRTGEGFVLIDTGIRGKRQALEAALSRVGCKPGTLKLVVITHGDVDHTGNCAYLRQTYGAPIAMHVADSEMVEHGEMRQNRIVKSRFLRTMHVFMRLFRISERMAATFEKFKPDFYLEDGQNLKDRGLDATVVHIPGHTAGSIGILFPSGDFICGDTLQNGSPATIIADEAELTSSIVRLSALNPKMVYPGHGRQFPWANP